MKLVIGYTEDFKPIHKSMISELWETVPKEELKKNIQYWRGFFRIHYSEFKNITEFHMYPHKNIDGLFTVKAPGLKHSFNIAQSFIASNKDAVQAIMDIIAARKNSVQDF